MKNLQSGSWINGYYLLTPLFMLLDYLFGMSFRISGFEDHGYRLAWYGLCLGCAAGGYFRPPYAPLIAIAESSINLLILLLAVMLPVIQLGNLPGTAGTYSGITGANLLNFLLSGGVLLLVFYSAQNELRRTTGSNR